MKAILLIKMGTEARVHEEVSRRMEEIRDSIARDTLQNYEALVKAYRDGAGWDEHWAGLTRRLCRDNTTRYSRSPYNNSVSDLNAFVADEVLTTKSYFGELTGGLERQFIMEHHKLPDRSPEWPEFYDRHRGKIPDRVLV